MNDSAPKMPSPPSHLNKVARKEWRRIVPKLREAGLVSHLDQANIGVYCQIIARIIEAEGAIAAEGTVVETPTGHRRANPWCAILNTSLRQLSAVSAQLGLSPNARKRVQLSDEKLAERFADSFGVR